MNKYSKGIFILFDGARWEVFEKLLKQNRLPCINKYFSGKMRKCIASFPTVSGPAHLPFMTGMFPGSLNIPGIYWFDRMAYGEGGINFRKFRSYLGPFKIQKMNRDIVSHAPNILNIFRNGAGIFVWFTRGGGHLRNMTRWKKAVSFAKGFFTKNWLQCDLDAEKASFDALNKNTDFIFSIFPATDELGHRLGPFHSDAEKSYENLDRVIGRIFSHASVTPDNTLLLVASDHGMSNTHTHIDLEGFVSGRCRKTMSYKRFVTSYFNIDSVVMASGNGMANLYFEGNSWKGDRPDFTDKNSPYFNIAGEIFSIPGIDMIAYRTPDHGIFIRSHKGSAEISCQKGIISYHVIDSDPFGYEKLPESMTFEEELALTFDTDYPDAPVGIVSLFSAPRSGDLIVMAKPGWDLRNWWEYQEAHGSHGTLHREHSVVPLFTNADISDNPMRTVDVFPTILDLLGREIPAGIDGISRKK
jgi:hypothetical protein